MADISTAPAFAQTLDPNEALDFKFELHDILEEDEEINPAEWTLEIPVEGAGLGLVIMDTDGRAPTLSSDNRSIIFWLAVEEDMKDAPIFDGAGTSIPLRVTGETNSIPVRTRQRTAKVGVAHQ